MSRITISRGLRGGDDSRRLKINARRPANRSVRRFRSLQQEPLVYPLLSHGEIHVDRVRHTAVVPHQDVADRHGW